MAARHYCIAKELQAQGHEVTYFMWQHPFGITKKELLKHLFTSLIPRTHQQRGFTVHKAIRLPLFWPVINGWIFKAQLRRLFKTIDADIIFTESYTNETEVPKELPFIYDLADDYAGPSEVYGSRIYKFAFRLLGVRTVMRRQCKNALAVTAVSSMLYNFAKQFNDNATLVPNGVERDLIENALVKRQSVKPHSLVYATGLGPWSRAIETLETITELRKEFPDISLTLVGAGTEVPKIKRYIKEHNAEDYITYMDYIYDRQELFTLQGQHAIGLNISDKNAWRDASHPMKVMDYSALGMKGVSTNLVEVEKLEYDNLFVFSDTDKRRGFKSVLRQALKATPQTYKKTSDYVLANYSWDKLVSTISSVATQALKVKKMADRNDGSRIVHVTYAYPPAIGGLEQVAQQLASSQAAAGLPVSVVTSDRGWDKTTEYTDTLPVTRLKSFVFANTTIIPGLLWQLLKLHKDDIIHLHVAQAFSPEIVWLASKIKGFRYVAHIHIDAPPSTWMGFLLRIYKPIVLGRVLRSAHGVVVFTKEQKKILGQRYRIDSSRVHIIPNGVADEFFINKRRNIHKKPRLLFVGRLSYQKNLTQLLDALDGISDQFTTTLVGDGELRADLEAHAKKLNLKNITFAGFASGATLRTYYEKADIFVLPSEREGMPLVLLEAMAAGLPIVATRVTGNKDVVKHNKNGLLVPYGNASALRAALLKLGASKSLYRSMSRTAAAMALTFTWTAVRERFASIYPQQVAKTDMIKPATNNHRTVGLPFAIIPLLIFAVAAYAIPNAIGSTLTLLFFLTAPGYLLLRRIASGLGGWWERAGLSVVLSLLVIMVGGLFLNTLHYIGLDRPLTTINTFITLSLVTLLLIWLNRNERIVVKLPKLVYPSILYLVVTVLITSLPVLAIGGAIRLNNGASNILTMIMFGAIAVLFFILLLKKDLKPLIPYALFMFALSILLSTSLRGWFITGHDIRNEFQVFKATNNRDLWLAVIPSHDPYNSCLSISILPTLLYNITHLQAEYIFKVVYQVVFAFGIIPMFYTFKKFLDDRGAFLAGFIVISFPTFMNDMTFLNRQEIAFLFFIALLYVTFSQIKNRSKYTLTVALLLGMLLSHYSTNYATIGLLVGAFVIYRILTFKTSTQKNLVVPILSIPIILFAIVTTYAWSSIITQSSSNLDTTIKKTISSLANSDNTQSNTTRFAILGGEKKTRQEILADYAGGHSKNITYIDEDIQPLTRFGAALNDHVNIRSLNNLIHSSIAKLYQVLVILGVIVLVIRHIIKRNSGSLTTMDTYMLAITSGAVAELVILTILPHVSISYDVGRLFMQSLFITAIPIIVAGEFIFKKTRKAIFLTAFLFMFIFLFISGFLPQLTGGYNPKIALANSGTYYNYFYEHRTDRAGSQWLVGNRDITKKIYLDTDASSKVPLYVSTGLFHDEIQEGYIFESYRNVTAKAYRAFPNDELIEYSDDRVSKDRNLLYVNKASAIYSPVVKRVVR